MPWTWFVNSCTEDTFIVMVLMNAVRNIVALLSGSKMVQGSELVFHLSDILVSEISWLAVLHSVYKYYISAVCKYGYGCAQAFSPLPDTVKKLFVYSFPIKIISKYLPLLKTNIKVAPVGNELILFLPSLLHQGKQNSRSANAHSTTESSIWDVNVPIVRKKGRKIICVK